MSFRADARVDYTSRNRESSTPRREREPITSRRERGHSAPAANVLTRLEPTGTGLRVWTLARPVVSGLRTNAASAERPRPRQPSRVTQRSSPRASRLGLTPRVPPERCAARSGQLVASSKCIHHIDARTRTVTELDAASSPAIHVSVAGGERVATQTAFARSPETTGSNNSPNTEPSTRWLEACKRGSRRSRDTPAAWSGCQADARSRCPWRFLVPFRFLQQIDQVLLPERSLRVRAMPSR